MGLKMGRRGLFHMPLLLLAAVVFAALSGLPACAQAYAVPPNEGTPERADVTVDSPAADVSLRGHISPKMSQLTEGI